jgi:hypothetical protein
MGGVGANCQKEGSVAAGANGTAGSASVTAARASHAAKTQTTPKHTLVRFTQTSANYERIHANTGLNQSV